MQSQKNKFGFTRTIIFMGAFILVVCGIARKCNGATAEPSLARVAFDAGKQAYNLQRYNSAAAYWGKAYELTNDPALLFNIGQAFRLAGQEDQAIASYRAFLREAPADSPNRDIAESKLELLQIMRLKAPKLQARTVPVVSHDKATDLALMQFDEVTAAPIEPTPTKPAHVVNPNYVIAGAAVTGIFAVTAIAFSLDARNTYNDLANTCGKTPGGCSREDRASVTTAANWATAFWIGTALVGGATGIAFAIDYQHTHNTQEASVGLAGRF